MRKILLLSGILFCVTIVCFFASIYFFISPDQFRPLISTQIEKYTGYKLLIDDHLTFSFFPNLAVRVNHIQIMSPNIDIKNATVQIKLIPLLHGKFETGTVQIDQLVLPAIRLNKIKLESFAHDKAANSYITNLSFDFNEDSLPITGHADISGDVTIDLKTDAYSVKNISSSISIDNITPQLTINGDLNASNNLNYPNISGHFTLQSSRIKIIDMNIDDIDCKLHFNNNMLSIESITANLYSGSLNGNAAINFEATFPTTNAHVKVFNIQIDPLLKLIQPPPTTIISGRGDIELDITTTGQDEISILNNLNGTTHVSITNGTLIGKDWDDSVSKYLPQHNGLFRFKELSASFTISNSILTCNDLLLTSAEMVIKGKGDINLLNNLFDFELHAEPQSPIENVEIPAINLKGALF